MDVHAARGNERTIRRVIALLVAFAVLAERAADRSGWVRLFVLWILRRAEVAAKAFYLDQAGMPPAIEGMPAIGNDAEGALHLAARLRLLAAALAALLPDGFPFGRCPARTFASTHRAPGSVGRANGCLLAPFDTS